MKKKNQLVSPFSQHLLARMALGVLMGMGVASSLLPQQVLADPNYDQPLQQFKKDQQNQDLYSPSSASGDFNVFNLIHQAQQGGPLRDMGEFSAEQSQNLDSAAAKFRLQQQQLLRNQQNQATPATPVMPSSEVKN